MDHDIDTRGERETHQDVRFCITPDGARIAFASAGRGPPLVRVASWLTHLELDWHSGACRHWLRALAASHTLVRFDVRGSGLSERRTDRLSLDTCVADLKAVVDAAGLDRFPLLGVSLGGAIAVAFAARYPERVSRLVLVGSGAKGAFAPGAPDGLRRDAEVLERMIEVGWGDGSPALRVAFARSFVPGASHEVALELSAMQRMAADADGARQLWRAFHAFDVTGAAKRVRCPTLVAHADEDAVVPLEHGRELAELIPGARLLALAGRNHLLLEDEPAWSAFLRAVRGFLGDAVASAFPDLTAREREVLDLIARGFDNRTITRLLERSPKTVRNHITSIFAKLGADHRAQAIVMAREAGFGRGELRPAA